MSIKYVLKRVGVAVLTVLVASLLTFSLLRQMPGDVVYNWARNLAQERGVTLEEAKRLVTSMINYDPDEPVVQQMQRYYGGLLKGDLGTSMIYKDKTVNELIAYALPWTLFIVSTALLLTFILGTQLGAIMAWKRKSIINPIITGYATIFGAVPFFIFAILLQILFCFILGWFPMNGAYSIWVTPGFNLEFILSVLHHATLPIFTFVITQLGGWALTMKGNAVAILGEDYINAAYARGIPEKIIRRRYMKKNAMLPMFTMAAIQFGTMLGGVTLIESTFIYPGMGQYLGTATSQRDFTVMQGILLVISIAVVIANLLVEIIYAKVDPRIKVED